MGVVWSILALIIGVVVAYLIYEEYIVAREGAEESEAEKEIQADLAMMEVEAGITEAADMVPQRTAAGNFVHQSEAGSVAAAPAAAATIVAAEAMEADDASVDSSPEVVAAAEEAALTDDALVEAAAVEDTAAEEAAAVEERVATIEVAVPAEAAAAPQPDDLTKIKGIGKVYAQRLNEAGIYTYAQVMDTDVETLETVTKAIPAANAYDWARQASKLV